jgi:porphobilinogen deaminase
MQRTDGLPKRNLELEERLTFQMTRAERELIERYAGSCSTSVSRTVRLLVLDGLARQQGAGA